MNPREIVPLPHPSQVVRCVLYARTPAGSAQRGMSQVTLWRYERVNASSSQFDTYLHTPCPPAVGDLVGIYDHITHQAHTLRVVERAWHHASYGSADWPPLEPLTTVGPMLDLICEAADGPFVNEAPAGPDPEEEMRG